MDGAVPANPTPTVQALPRAACSAMEVFAGCHGDIIIYRTRRGRVGHSHGLKAASLAGMSPPVMDRAGARLAHHAFYFGSVEPSVFTSWLVSVSLLLMMLPNLWGPGRGG